MVTKVYFWWQCILTRILTYSMVQSPSWEANWFAASQEIPHISRNLKVHYRTHKRPPPVSILGQPNPVHIPTSHLLEIHPNIIHPSTPRSASGLLPSGFPSKNLYTPLSSPIRATYPAHLIQVTKLAPDVALVNYILEVSGSIIGRETKQLWQCLALQSPTLYCLHFNIFDIV